MDACCGDIPISATTIVWAVQVWKDKNLEITLITKNMTLYLTSIK